MATKTSAEDKKVPEAKYDPKKDLVPFRAFKDSDKYSDDIVVGVNGKIYKIKRGVTVMIPRHVYAVLENSMNQDSRTADLIAKEKESYARGEKELAL